MKYIYSLLFATALLSSCGGDKKKSVEDIIASDNIELIRKKKAELDATRQEISAQLKQLETKIKELDPQEKVPLITTFKTSETVFNHFIELQGSVDTKENLVIYPEFSGTLIDVYVKEGQDVTKGQLLAKIDDGGLSQQLAQLEIQRDLAKTTFERQERLWKENIGSEIQYLQTKSSYEAMNRSVDQLKDQVAKTTVRAPFSCISKQTYRNGL